MTAATTFTVGAGQDFSTLQEAWAYLCRNVDVTYDVTLQLTAATHVGLHDTGAGGEPMRYQGGGRVIIAGSTTPGATIIEEGATDWCVHIRYNCILVQNVELQGSGEGGLVAALNGIIQLGEGVRFGAMSGEHMHASSGGQIFTDGVAYSIVGGAGRHIYAGQGGQARVLGSAVTITGTPAFSDAFAVAGTDGVVDVRDATFTGSATGKRFIAHAKGTIMRETDDMTDLPGNVAGTLAPGAAYDNIIGPLPTVIASGSFPAAAVVVVPLPVWAKSVYVVADSLSFNTANRHPVIEASVDGGSTWLAGHGAGATNYSTGSPVNPESTGSIVDFLVDVAAAREWDIRARIEGLAGGGLASRFEGLTDDFSVVLQQGIGLDGTIDRVTHIRITSAGAGTPGNFDGGTYSVRAD